MQLPAHLQNRTNRRDLASKAIEGLGTALPPHISIQGNNFTLIDATGNEQSLGPTMEACVIDVSDVTCKRFYSKPYDPNANDPPDCFSANGLGPSRDAANPQAATCAECPKNIRGSAVSKISGAAIKACRDEKWLCLLFPQFPNMLFQLVLTPGSFSNWKAYMAKFAKTEVGLDDVVTTFSFVPKENGVLAFNAKAFIEKPLADVREKQVSAKSTDMFVGRTDVARQGALPAPASAPGASPITQPAIQPAAQQSSVFGGAPVEQPQRRKRRTAAEAPDGEAAPFRPQEPAQAGNGNFGIQQPSPLPTDNAIDETLKSLFPA